MQTGRDARRRQEITPVIRNQQGRSDNRQSALAGWAGVAYGNWVSGAVQRAQYGLDRGNFDVRVHRGSPSSGTVRKFDLNVGYGPRAFPGAQRMFAVISDFKLRRASQLQRMHKRSDRHIAF